MEKKKLYRKCDFCGELGVANEEVFWLIDYYIQDVKGQEVWAWFHNDCSEENAQDI